ncbi:metallophosphoesterase [Halobacillus fulvus]|nr:metallophosphoesterase [Halobacillus fulvus]
MGIAVMTVALLLCLLFYMYFNAQNDYLDVKEWEDQTFTSEHPLRIFFISDVHNRVINEKTLAKVGEVDLIIVGGDLVDQRTRLDKIKFNLKSLKQLNGDIFFIPGNNDHELVDHDLLGVLSQEGIGVLSNEDYVFFHHDTPIVLSGIDPYFMKPRRTLSAVDDFKDYQILCIHDPFVYRNMNKEDQKNFNLILSGHTHGGQIRLFGFGPYQRGGWVRKGNRSELVSEGYGTSLLPLRLGTKAECHKITIHSSNVV